MEKGQTSGPLSFRNESLSCYQSAVRTARNKLFFVFLIDPVINVSYTKKRNAFLFTIDLPSLSVSDDSFAELFCSENH